VDSTIPKGKVLSKKEEITNHFLREGRDAIQMLKFYLSVFNFFF